MRAVAVPADKRFRRAQIKPARKRSLVFARAWLAIRIVIVLAITVYGGWRGTALLLGAPALEVSRIVVRGNARLSTGEVLALVDGLRGANILTVDLDHWQTRVLASPWVEEVHMRRELPARVEIEIRERRPVGIGRLSGTLYLVDAKGVVIDEYGPKYADLDMPIVDGLGARSADGITAVDEGRARLAARVLAALHSHPELGRRVSLIDVSDAHDAVVMLESDTVMLRLGSDEFVDRIQEYLELAPTLRERVPNIDYVDLRFDERLYVRAVDKK